MAGPAGTDRALALKASQGRAFLAGVVFFGRLTLRRRARGRLCATLWHSPTISYHRRERGGALSGTICANRIGTRARLISPWMFLVPRIRNENAWSLYRDPVATNFLGTPLSVWAGILAV